MERRGIFEKFEGGRFNRLGDLLHGDEVRERRVCHSSHISILINRMNVGVIFPYKEK